MKIWSWQLLPYLPDLQFKGQLRELVAIMHDWRDKGKTNHILINRVMEYPKEELTAYYFYYADLYEKRYGKRPNKKYDEEFLEFANLPINCKTSSIPPFFIDWHDEDYAKCCMTNLYEKYRYGLGKSRITMEEWNLLSNGYYEQFEEPYII